MRRHLVIEPRFQAGFVLAFVRGVLLAVAIPAGGIFLTVLVLSKNPMLSDTQQLALVTATHQLTMFFVLSSFVLGIASAVVGLFLSHRYAGPLKRVESWAARQLLGEHVEELALRPGDELGPMAQTLARIMEKENQP